MHPKYRDIVEFYICKFCVLEFAMLQLQRMCIKVDHKENKRKSEKVLAVLHHEQALEILKP